MRPCALLLSLGLIAVQLLCAADPATKAQLSRINALSKGGTSGLPELSGLLKDPQQKIRLEAVKAIIRIGSSETIPPLITATNDQDSEVRIMATDGIVNVYMPGYVSRGGGLGGLFARGVRGIKALASSRNDQAIDPDVKVREDAAQAIAAAVEAGTEMDSRSNAALAAGILRDRLAVPALVKGLRSTESGMIFECLVALQKIQDPSAGPGITFLLGDLDERTQITALQTVGILKATAVAPDVRRALRDGKTLDIRRAALAALAMFALPEDRQLFHEYSMNGDQDLRASALEGLGRVREPEDTPALQKSFDESEAGWKVHLASAFGLVNEGNVSSAEFSPLLYLIESLETKNRGNVATAYLIELARRDDVRKGLVKVLPDTSKTQKIALCEILGSSREDDVAPALDELSKDPDAEIASAAKRGRRILKTPKPS